MSASAAEERRDDLLDYAIDNAGGFTNRDAMAEFDWTLDEFNRAVHDARIYLGDWEDFNLPCEPQGQGEPWLYKLVGSLDEVRGWTANRMADADTRLRTIQSMVASIVNATNGRTKTGRKARLIERALRRLIEDLDDIELNGANP